MRYKLSEIAALPVAGEFNTGDTVTISLIDLDTGVAEPLDSASCSEIGATGIFKWSFADLTTQPTTFKRFMWTMTNGVTSQKEIVDCGGWAEEMAKIDNLVQNPTMKLDSEDVKVGNTWSPRFELQITDINTKVKIDITDGGGSVLSKATSNVTGGADSQVKLISTGDVFLIYRLYVTASESALFSGGNSVHLNITATLSDSTVISKAYKIPLSSVSAITWNAVV